MIVNDKALAVYFDITVDSVFKILPLYEEKNIGIVIYIESLLSELDSLKDIIEIKYSYEYLSLMATLMSAKKEIEKEDSEHAVVKRELFKCINIIKNLIAKLEDGV